MARTVRFALVLIAALGAIMAAAADNRVDLGGIYLCEGVNPDGTPYKGIVEITPTADSYRVRWTMAEQNTTGVGIFRGGVLAVSYFGGTPGVAVYRVDGARLLGEWTMGNSGASCLRKRSPSCHGRCVNACAARARARCGAGTSG